MTVAISDSKVGAKEITIHATGIKVAHAKKNNLYIGISKKIH